MNSAYCCWVAIRAEAAVWLGDGSWSLCLTWILQSWQQSNNDNHKVATDVWTMILTEHLTASSLSNTGHILPFSLLVNCTILLEDLFFSIYSLFVGTQVQRSENNLQVSSSSVYQIQVLRLGWRCLCPLSCLLTPSHSFLLAFLGSQFMKEYGNIIDKAVETG